MTLVQFGICPLSLTLTWKEWEEEINYLFLRSLCISHPVTHKSQEHCLPSLLILAFAPFYCRSLHTLRDYQCLSGLIASLPNLDSTDCISTVFLWYLRYFDPCPLVVFDFQSWASCGSHHCTFLVSLLGLLNTLIKVLKPTYKFLSLFKPLWCLVILYFELHWPHIHWACFIFACPNTHLFVYSDNRTPVLPWGAMPSLLSTYIIWVHTHTVF